MIMTKTDIPPAFKKNLRAAMLLSAAVILLVFAAGCGRKGALSPAPTEMPASTAQTDHGAPA